MRLHGAKSTAPIAAYYCDSRCIAVKAHDVTDTLRSAMTANIHGTGVQAHKISARSLRAGGAMALLCGKVDFDLIRILGRWHSDAMIQYLHMQAQSVMQNFAANMFNNGTHDFLPDEMVPSTTLTMMNNCAPWWHSQTPYHPATQSSPTLLHSIPSHPNSTGS
jgi:hypothetical protein